MADTKKTSTPADLGLIAPGESNDRAVRDGIRTRVGSSGSSKNAAPEGDTVVETRVVDEPIDPPVDVAAAEPKADAKPVKAAAKKPKKK